MPCCGNFIIKQLIKNFNILTIIIIKLILNKYWPIVLQISKFELQQTQKIKKLLKLTT